MRTTLLAAGAVAAGPGSAALAWGDPQGHHHPWRAGAAVTDAAHAGPPWGRMERRDASHARGRDLTVSPHRRNGREDGGQGDLLGSVFFFGLFSH